jgi:UDP-4-amino-4,6-dideoxy-N-acetyl-beta-L-altrosamine N-acetyltransferase
VSPPQSRFVPLDEERLELVRHWRNKDRIRRNMRDDHLISSEEQRRWFHGLHGDGTRRYLVYEQNGRPVGMLYFSDVSPLSAVMGYYLGEESCWPGSGVLLQIAGIDYAFDVLQTDTVVAEVVSFNTGPQRLHRAFGFRLEDAPAGTLHRDGASWIILRYRLTSTDWRQTRGTVLATLPRQVRDAAGTILFQ